MAERSCTPAPSRRALFGAAAALPVLAAAPALAASHLHDGGALPGGTLPALLARHDAALAAYNGADPTSEAEGDAEFWRLCDMRNDILDAPIRTRADAAAKLKLAIVSFDEGLLSNGKDVEAAAQVVRWLEAGR